ncbi:MAG TPA: hypothetical protein EYG85_11825, partial [Crocinitomix sp.]|nr:hypothetical protein [Crocinitomix sp.]
MNQKVTFTLNPQISSTAKPNCTPLLGMPVCVYTDVCVSQTCATPITHCLFYFFIGVRDFRSNRQNGC